MGRAVVRRPKVFLFDEPLSNLDAALRGQMRVELMRLHHQLKATMIYVTHDQVEAMTLANRIAVLNQGRLLQIGPPDDLYLKPANELVARFIGTPEMSLLDAARAQSAGLVQGLPATVARVGVRAEDLELCRSDDGIEARVAVIEHLGWESLVHVTLGVALELTLRAETARIRPLHVGERVHIRVEPHKLHCFSAYGERLEMAQLEKRALP
jgi:ABC-type sugar transport system ATPase subunit